MPSPFPGMDPYLEDHSLWPDVHSSLIAYIREALQPQVRPKYLARIGERVELTELGKGYIPDVLIIEPPHNPFPSIQGQPGVLVADAPQRLKFLDEERRVPYIEIIYRQTGDVVTVIEVLSPVKKSGAGQWQYLGQYLQKQEDLGSSQVNLVEIDLLRGGEPTTLARLAAITQPSDWCYNVTIDRAANRSMLDVYAFGLQERLPRCQIPLRPADGDVVLDLPAVFARCYDVGGYDLLLDYTRKPPVAFNEAEQQWVRQLLQTVQPPSQ